MGFSRKVKKIFLSTPSVRRATPGPHGFQPSQHISIHALRTEGDPSHAAHDLAGGTISIHALRTEGDP